MLHTFFMSVQFIINLCMHINAFFPPESWLIYQHTSAYIPPMFKIPVLSIMI